MKELNVNYGMVKEVKKDHYSVGFYICLIALTVPTMLAVCFISIAITETLAAIRDVIDYGMYSLELYYESQKWLWVGIGVLLIVLFIAFVLLMWLGCSINEFDACFSTDEERCEQCIKDLGPCCGKEQCEEDNLLIALTLFIVATIILTIFFCICFGGNIHHHLLKGLFSGLSRALILAFLGALSSSVITFVTKMLYGRKIKRANI